MAVTSASPHCAEHDGRPHGFCSAGCRKKFLTSLQPYPTPVLPSASTPGAETAPAAAPGTVGVAIAIQSSRCPNIASTVMTRVEGVVGTIASQVFPASFIAMGREAVSFEAAAMIISLTLLARPLELKACSQSSAVIQSLLGLARKTAQRVAADGSEEDIPLTAGMLRPFTGWPPSPMVDTLAMSLSSASIIGSALRLRGAVIGER